MVDVSACENFSDFLAKLMQAERIERKDLESLLGVSKGMVEKYVNKGSTPTDATLQVFCRNRPAYDFKALHDLAHGIKKPHTEHAVRTEYGAKIGRIAESITDDALRLALLQLVSSLERDSQKGTGTE